MTDQEIRYLGDVRKLDLGPNDVIVIEYSGPISQDSVRRLTEYVSEAIGTDHKVLVLGEGLKLGVLSPQE
jgi:hypothetical protein